MTATLEAPVHGDRGEAPPPATPRTRVIAISREVGARGGAVARRVGRALGWQLVDQEILDYMAQEPDTAGDFSPAARAWAETELARLRESQTLADQPQAVQFARTVLTLAARGDAVLLGRGAGLVLPAASTLHVRVVAPLDERVAYMAQQLRLTTDAAAEAIRQRDEHRRHYLESVLGSRPHDACPYDLVVNVGRLGEELCADVIVQAARAKWLQAS